MTMYTVRIRLDATRGDTVRTADQFQFDQAGDAHAFAIRMMLDGRLLDITDQAGERYTPAQLYILHVDREG